ncbi:major capsid protein [Flavobacterium sp. phage 1/32]|nr:major capsid protein [Flavobacterium sp. phage 1/32]
MAGLLDTYLQEIRGVYPNQFDANEWRFTQSGLLTAVKEMTESPLSLVTQDIKDKALASEGRSLKIPVIKQGELTIKNQRTCNISDFENESALVTVDWTTLVVDISMVKAQYAKNEITYLQDLNKKLLLVKEAFTKAMEQAIYARLELAKSTTYNSSLVGAGAKYDLVGDAIQVPLADQELFFNDLDVIMNEDDFNAPNFQVLGSTPLRSPVTHYINQGAGNDENLNYQFAGKSFRFSNRVPSGAGNRASGFFMTDGSIAMLTRTAIDSVMGNVAGDGTRWETVMLDGFPFEIGVMHKSQCSDQKDLNGTGMEHLTATMVEKWQFSIDFGIVTPYQSDPSRPQPIKKFEFKSA